MIEKNKGNQQNIVINSHSYNGSNLNNLTIVTKDKIIINGENVPSPPRYNNRNSSVSNINGTVYINGWEWISKKKKWKRTLRAIWYWLF